MNDSTAVFNVKNFGATGKKEDDAQPAIQKAIDACAEFGFPNVITFTGFRADPDHSCQRPVLHTTKAGL